MEIENSRVVVKSRKPFKLWLALAISLERLIVSGAVKLGGRSVGQCGKLVTVSVTSLSH